MARHAKQHASKQKQSNTKSKHAHATPTQQPMMTNDQTGHILNLQRTIGNQATFNLLKGNQSQQSTLKINRQFKDDAFLTRDAEQALHVASDILMHRRGRMLDTVSSKYRPTLYGLLQAIRLHKQPPATERLEKLEAATALLNTLKDYTSDPDWFEYYIARSLRSNRKNIQYTLAMERTENAVLVGDNKVMEQKELEDPAKLMELLEVRRGTMLSTLNALMGQVHKIEASPKLRKEADKFIKEAGLDSDKFSVDMVKGLVLELSPIKKLDMGLYKGENKDKSAKRDGWTTTAETTKMVLISIKNMQVVLKNASEIVYVVARVSKNPQLAKTALDLSDGVGSMLAGSSATGAKGLSTALKIGGHLLTAVEIIHSIAVLLDPTASTDQKVDAAVGGAGAVVGIASAPLGAAIGITWLQVKFMAASYWELRASFAQYAVNKAAETMQYIGDSLSKKLDELAKAKLLLEKETDPEQIEAMDKLINQRYIPGLKKDVEYLYNALPVTIRRLFADLVKEIDTDDPAIIAGVATKTLQQIMHCFANPKKMFDEAINP